MYVTGIDPGSFGALATYCSETQRIVDVQDIPTFYQSVGKRKLKRIDVVGVADMFGMMEIMGTELFVMEEVGGRPGESASGSYTFGFGVGILYYACFMSGIPIETVPAGVWKAIMRVKGKSKATTGDLMLRGAEVFPKDHHKFRGPKGGARVDRMEAAFIAKFGAEHLVGTSARIKPKTELDSKAFRSAFRAAKLRA